MSRHLRSVVLIGIGFLCMECTAWAGEETVANPYYKFWAGFKPGSTAVRHENTKLSGPEGKLVPDGVDEKHITYKLLEVNKDRVEVEMVVTERDFLGFVQAAPTRYIYPAKLKKSHLERVHLAHDDVPGAIVKQVRTARQKAEVIAETTTTLQSFKKAD